MRQRSARLIAADQSPARADKAVLNAHLFSCPFFTAGRPGQGPLVRSEGIAVAATNEIEEGLVLRPKFDAAGLVTCVTTDAGNGDVLMVAHMNEEALRRTIDSGEAWYFSRSRGALWRKGESSGHVQRVVEMRLDW